MGVVGGHALPGEAGSFSVPPYDPVILIMGRRGLSLQKSGILFYFFFIFVFFIFCGVVGVYPY